MSNIWYRYILFLLGKTLIFFSPTVFANEFNYEDYDSIVSRLSAGSSIKRNTVLPFEDIQIHTGIGIVSSRIALNGPQIPTETGFLKGIEATLGIDLFSPYWIAEGAVRSFSEETLTHSQVSLKEFDLKFIRRTPIGKQAFLRIGFGVAARYLEYFGSRETSVPVEGIATQEIRNVPFHRRVKTPASVFLIGASAELTHFLSLGSEISIRSAMIDETIEDSAIQGSIRLDLHY